MRHALLALVLLLALPARAQLVTASLTGRVSVSDAPAPGVTVTVTSPALQQPRSTLTNARGTYWLDALPHGEYDVTFSRAGLTSLTRRAVLQTARIARADATLEPSEDEETVTSTATTPSVVDTTAVTTHFNADTLDRLPVHREIFNVAALAPVIGTQVVPTVDDVFLIAPGLIAEDALDEVTVVRGAVPADLERPTIVARTRAPRERFFLTLRDTLTSTRWLDDRFRGVEQSDAIEHQVDLTAGGRIIPERLWFFGAAWLGDEADTVRYDQRGALLKLTGSLNASHSVTAAHLDTQSLFTGITRDNAATTSLRYTGVFGPRITGELLAARTPVYNPGGVTGHVDTVNARGSFFAGDHVLTAGGSRAAFDNNDTWAIFAGDRWSVAKWTVYAGVRHQESTIEAWTLPRVAVAYDVRGNARHALTASYGHYPQFREPSSVAAIGYAYAFAANGHARIDLLRRDENGSEVWEAQLEGRYRLFDRFEAGGNYAYLEHEFFGDRQIASAWAGLELPFGEHELGMTVLQRILHGEFAGGRPRSETITPTDLALRYSLPVSRAHLTLAADWTNALSVSIGQIDPRALRFWVRVRI